MKNLKVISVVLSLCMLLSLITPTLAADSSAGKDTPSSWAAEKVALAIEAGIVPPHLQGDYQKDITRYEYAELIIRFIETYTGLNIDDALVRFYKDKYKNTFSDTDDNTVLSAYSLGIFHYSLYGIKKMNFNADKPVLRQKMAYALYTLSKMIARHFYIPSTPFIDEYKADNYAKQAIQYVKSKNIVSGTGGNKFSPLDNVTREQAIITACNLLLVEEVPFNKMKSELLLYSYDDVYIENEYFILHIDKDMFYSKNLENYIVEGFKLAETITGLSLFPEPYRDKKIILEALNVSSYASSNRYSLLSKDALIVNNKNNEAIFTKIAAEFIYRRNITEDAVRDFYSEIAYSNCIYQICNMKYKFSSEIPFCKYSDGYIAENDFMRFINDSFSDIIYTDYYSNKSNLPSPLRYLFWMFVYDKYGIGTVNNLILSINSSDILDENSKEKYISDIIGLDVKEQFINWYKINSNKYLISGNDPPFSTNNFLHNTLPITITDKYYYIPNIMSFGVYYTPLCFMASDTPVKIDMSDGYKLMDYLGESLDKYYTYIKCSSTIKIKTYNKENKLISTDIFGGSYGNETMINKGYYYEISGKGLCEISIYKY